MSTTIKVYLDSSDFSVLSDIKKKTSESVAIADQLFRWSDSGDIQFVFSGVHLTEMAPLRTADSKAAEARADLLERLCRRNAMLSSDKVIHAELQYLKDSSTTAFNTYSAIGEWFPDVGHFVEQIDVQEILDIAIAEIGLNRKQRRDLGQISKNKLSESKMRAYLPSKILENGGLDTLMASYPMTQANAQTIMRFLLDEGTKEEAETAFLESLRSPGTFVRWFEKNRGTFNPFVESFRRPGREMLAKIEDTLRDFNALRGQSFAQVDYDLTAARWRKMQDELLCSAVMNAMQEAFPDFKGGVSASRIDQYCPGMSTFFRTIHSAIRDSLGRANQRRPSSSDYVDGLHALYAPYVDIFRADSYMSQHIKMHVSRHETTIVPNLSQLIPAIRVHLNEKD